MAGEWYARVDGNVFGPLSIEEARRVGAALPCRVMFRFELDGAWNVLPPMESEDDALWSLRLCESLAERIKATDSPDQKSILYKLWF